MGYDINGDYINTNQDLLNEKIRKENRFFIKRVELFLLKHSITGNAYSYGFSTTKPELALRKLKEIGIKFRIDKTPNFHTKVIISRNSILQ